jgi:two-component system cell cycle sensor histidine kinase/response regulator CckA
MERTDFEQWKAKEVARLLALVETERRYYQEMVASLPVALVVLSADHYMVSANRAFRQLFGLRTEDLRRKAIEQVLPSDHLIESIRSAHVQGPQPDLFLDLGTRSLRIAIIPIRNWDDESEVETLLMLEDLSAIAAAKATAPVPGKAAPIVPAEVPVVAFDIPAVVWRADAATLTFQSVSAGVEALLGYPVTHWLETEQFFTDRIHPEDRDSTLEFYRAAITRGGDASAEYRAVSASGGEVWCRETIRSAGGGAPSITGVITDITRRKQLEEQLLTAERTIALQGLASRLAHDLNNPLMIVTGYGEEMLNVLAPQDPMRGDVEQILAATERISAITGQLLSFTQRHANPPEPLDVGSLVAGLEEKIREAVGESVTLEMTPVLAPVWAKAEASQLEEVLLTLISSAREDAQERSRVVIGCEVDSITEQLVPATLEPGMYARLVIHDDGRGLDGEKRVAVFEGVLGGRAPEQTAGQTLVRAYAIVREWGGDIAFFSEPFRGSTFAVYLPYFAPPVQEIVEEILETDVAIPVEAVTEPDAAAAEPVEETRETILVVEDEPGIRALVRKILRRERYNVLEAGSGEEALKVAAEHAGPIDLLLTDVMLPGILGSELAGRMRESAPALDVLYISGYTDDEAVRMGAFPPGSKFLQKPFTLGTLVTKVRDALDA